MSIISGTTRVKTWKGDYDFAVDGGAVSTITLRSDDGPIPSGSYILSGILEIATALDSSGSATAAVQIEAANDTINAAAFGGAPWSSTGRKSLIEVGTGATSVKTTADRSPAVVIGTAALTAGKFSVIVTYR